jgi:hypothetical protein
MGAVVTCDVEGCTELFRVYGRAINPERDAEKNGWVVVKAAYRGKPYEGIHLCPTHGTELNGILDGPLRCFTESLPD